LDGGETLGRSLKRFHDRYFHLGFFNNWIPNDDAFENIMERVAPVTIRFERDECFELPEVVREVREVEMSREQRRLYNDIMGNLVVELEGGVITINNVLTKVIKLAQVAGGFIQHSEGVDRLKKNPKLDVLLELMDEVFGKAVVFHHFVEEGRMIEEACGKANVEFRSLRGEIRDKQNQYREFRDDPDGRVLVAHPMSGGEGINLPEANVEIFYSFGFVGAPVRAQAEGRVHRLGQTQRCVFLDLVLKDSSDERVLAAMHDKEDLAKSVLDWIRLWVS
jgi:SNF2 family DNA or RNA helicase